MKSSTAVLFTLFLACGHAIKSQDHHTLVFDVSKLSPGTNSSEQVDNLSLTHIEITNKLPKATYNFKIKLERVIIPPLQAGTANETEEFEKKNLPGGTESGCDKLKSILDSIDALKPSNQENWPEKEIPNKIEQINSIIDACSDEKTIKRANDLITATSTKQILNNVYKLRLGEKLIIEVSSGSRTWTHTFTTAPRGEWFASYGFTFLSQGLQGHGTYHLEETTGGFNIVRDNDPKLLDLDFVPAIYYSWMPYKWQTRNGSHSLTGGLGFDLSNPVVLVGYNYTFNYNLGLYFGVAFHQQNRLKAQYQTEKFVSQSLDFDQLHDNVYRPNLSFGVIFRFNSSPFSRSNSSNTTAGDTQLIKSPSIEETGDGQEGGESQEGEDDQENGDGQEGGDSQEDEDDQEGGAK